MPETNSRQVCLKIVSEYGCEILTEYKVTLYDLHIPRFNELLENIWDIHPYLYHEENYEIYWNYKDGVFLKVCDYFSYFTALNLMAEDIFYVVLQDTESWIYDSSVSLNLSEDNTTFFKHYQMNKFFYMDYEEFCAHRNLIRHEDILMEALFELPRPRYYNIDEMPRYRIADHAKLGKKKILEQLILPDDNVINLRPKIEKPKAAKKSPKKKGKKK